MECFVYKKIFFSKDQPTFYHWRWEKMKIDDIKNLIKSSSCDKVLNHRNLEFAVNKILNEKGYIILYDFDKKRNSYKIIKDSFNMIDLLKITKKTPKISYYYENISDANEPSQIIILDEDKKNGKVRIKRISQITEHLKNTSGFWVNKKS